jgi:predicted  nucleic acid-binding Zn-ribbon protein
MEEELKEKMLTLERFNKFSVGREMKMVELKNQIETLKAEIAKAGP